MASEMGYNLKEEFTSRCVVDREMKLPWLRGGSRYGQEKRKRAENGGQNVLQTSQVSFVHLHLKGYRLLRRYLTHDPPFSSVWHIRSSLVQSTRFQGHCFDRRLYPCFKRGAVKGNGLKKGERLRKLFKMESRL